MTCQKCDHDLAKCTCHDLEARFNSLSNSPYIHFGEEYKARIRAHIERTKAEQTKNE